MENKQIPTQGLFLDGQVFDAHELTSRIIRSAKQRIVLIDNYIDEQTFTQLSKKLPEVLHPPLTESDTRQSRQTLSSLEGGSVSLLEEGLREVITNNTATSK
jgi:hypothetical protein